MTMPSTMRGQLPATRCGTHQPRRDIARDHRSHARARRDRRSGRAPGGQRLGGREQLVAGSGRSAMNTRANTRRAASNAVAAPISATAPTHASIRSWWCCMSDASTFGAPNGWPWPGSTISGRASRLDKRFEVAAERILLVSREATDRRRNSLEQVVAAAQPALVRSCRTRCPSAWPGVRRPAGWSGGLDHGRPASSGPMRRRREVDGHAARSASCRSSSATSAGRPCSCRCASINSKSESMRPRSPHTSGACWIVEFDASSGAPVRRCSAPDATDVVRMVVGDDDPAHVRRGAADRGRSRRARARRHAVRCPCRTR